MERASKQTIFHSTSPLRQGGCLNRQVLQKLSEKAKQWVTEVISGCLVGCSSRTTNGTEKAGAANVKGTAPWLYLCSWDTVVCFLSCPHASKLQEVFWQPTHCLSSQVTRQGAQEPSPCPAHEQQLAHKAMGVGSVNSLQATPLFHNMSLHGRVTSSWIACPGGCRILPTCL